MSVRTFAAQKAALTRITKNYQHPRDLEKLKAEIKRTIAEWDSHEGQFNYGWPDDWARWRRAAEDLIPWYEAGSILRDLGL